MTLSNDHDAASVWAGARRLVALLTDNLAGRQSGTYSVCSSHPLVIEAAIDQARADGSDLLVEATANQVNQFGGYTGMRPADFRRYVEGLAAARGLARDRLILGGDHLGPVCWAADPAEEAMAKAEALVGEFAAAGFAKIHLDCSMALAGDPPALDDATVAARAARLCAVAERAATAAFGQSGIVYVIGTEVPPPGGADEVLGEIEVTPAARVEQTLAVHRAAFAEAGLAAAWGRVVALVVQPGVEFDHSAVIDYDPQKATHLKQLAETGSGGIVFEAHSTDYQPDRAFAELVRDHFAILKVGPALTFALREALFALSHIEDELIPASRRSGLRAICEERMLAAPAHWRRFYEGDAAEQALLRRYSLSDRIRYYWPDPAIERAVSLMFENLDGAAIPLGLLSQYLPRQYQDVRAGRLDCDARALARAGVRYPLAPYAQAVRG